MSSFVDPPKHLKGRDLKRWLRSRAHRERIRLARARRPIDTCPACGAKSVVALPRVQGQDHPYDGCLKCQAFWERETRREPLLERCDNCAFRAGSPEQRDPEEWTKIVKLTEQGGTFYCHKRVPIDPDGKGFKHQMSEDGRECTNATPCAGWLAARLAILQKGVPNGS